MTDTLRTFYIKHIQRVAFDIPVFCEPTLIRLHPRTDAQGIVRSARLDVTPRPAGIQRTTDLCGNVLWRVWFNELTVSLSIAVTSCVDRFVIGMPGGAPPGIPSGLRRGEDRELANYYAHAKGVDPWIADLTEQVFEQSRGREYEFLRLLARSISERALSDQVFVGLGGPSGAGVPAGAMARRRWALAEQLADAGRLMNLPARIVRGYNAGEADEIESEMHVWTEFYLTERGWCGFDPSRGTPVDHQYIPVAAGRTRASTISVSGEYRGTSRPPETSTQIILREAARADVISPTASVAHGASA